MTEGTKPKWNPNNATETALWEKYGTTWCGLEVEVVDPANPAGKRILAIVDAFDWVPAARSDIDIMRLAWEQVAGRPAVSKLDVIKNVQWRLTGTRNPKYAFGAQGDL